MRALVDLPGMGLTVLAIDRLSKKSDEVLEIEAMGCHMMMHARVEDADAVLDELYAHDRCDLTKADIDYAYH